MNPSATAGSEDGPTVRVTRYDPGQAAVWNTFVARAKNGLFLFDRSYMDYHADRFRDHSLMFWQGETLIALVPASERDGVLSSHGGLTFGGVLSDTRMRAATMLKLFAALRRYLASAGFSVLVYKAIPHIYHQAPAEEDLYALMVNGARLVRRDLSSTISLGHRVKYAKGRKWSTSRALSAGLTVDECRDFRAFMALEEAHLLAKFGVRPTHSADEIQMLADRFPANIRLFTASRDGALLGGMVVYESARVAHAQYIAATDQGRELGSLDAIMHHLLETVYGPSHAYFDFGISTERAGTTLNAGLAANKESYGARATVHDFYELPAA
jgi:hypothetical protein